MRTPIAGMPEVKATTYEAIRVQLDRMGFAKMIDKEGTPLDEQGVKAATQYARIDLQKKGYIAFNDGYCWLV